MGVRLDAVQGDVTMTVDGPTRSVQGVTMTLNPGDEGLSADLLADGIREPITTQAYQERLRELPGPVTVVDVGANIGYYALMPLAVRPDATVLAIEPDPESVAYLRQNIAQNGYGDRATVVECGVSPETGTKTLHRFTKRNANSMAPSKKELYHSVYVDDIEVPVRPLDDIVTDPAEVDVIRMDVEGYDYEVLESGSGILAAVGECLIAAEFHPRLHTDEQNANLRALLKRRPTKVLSAAENRTPLDIGSIGGIFEYIAPEVILRWGGE